MVIYAGEILGGKLVLTGAGMSPKESKEMDTSGSRAISITFGDRL